MRSVNRMRAVAAFVAMAAIGPLGCDRLFNRLTRDKAKAMIESNPAFSEVGVLPFAAGPDRGIDATKAIEGGLREGLWATTGEFTNLSIVLTERGRKHFSSIDVRLGLFPSGHLTPLKPLRRRVHGAVTGIQEVDKATRIVQFNWRFEGQTPIVERYSGLSSHVIWTGGEAAFKLYDDGWRIESIRLPMSQGVRDDVPGVQVSGAEVFRADEAAQKAADQEAAGATRPKLMGAWAGMHARPSGFGSIPVKIVVQPADNASLEAVQRFEGYPCVVMMSLLRNELDMFIFELASVRETDPEGEQESRRQGSCKPYRYLRLRPVANESALAAGWYHTPPTMTKLMSAEASATLQPASEEGGL